jgi:hypothetical protein
MKKMLAMIIALVVATAAEAVQINWSTLAGQGWGAGNAGNMVLLVRSAVNANTTAGVTLAGNGAMTLAGGLDLLGVGLLNGSGDLASVAIVQSAGNWSAAGTLGVVGLSNFTATKNNGVFPATVGSMNAGATGKMDYYLVVFNNTTLETATQMNQVKVSNTSPSLATANLALQFDQTNKTGWTAVPEPTSMALLALGVAAVGLRRRFKK